MIHAVKTSLNIQMLMRNTGLNAHLDYAGEIEKIEPKLVIAEQTLENIDNNGIYQSTLTARHKRIPLVYAGIIIKPNELGSLGAVSPSGPTYISIRSGRHSSSTAAIHDLDSERLPEIGEFDTILKATEVVKPAIVMKLDDGPDENIR
ncbi:hypothetical protein QAD02_007552 [Eretmocerus hayati]|uniref:Uncharacterized protein n=1 Tax=Eretmocerus hayati TaxID=131215 RepID=A0ACC2N400_9HYME|nr:hypothetical protein QAD02_007552 [Eretmocerus hayati]